MKNWFWYFIRIFLVCIICIGFISSVAFVAVKYNEEISESELEVLLKQQNAVTENFSELSKIKGAEFKVKVDKIIVTFYEKETKLEAAYDKEYNLISSTIMHNRIYDKPEGICLVIIMGGLLIPVIIWFVVVVLMATIHGGIMALKRKKDKQKEDNKTYCTQEDFE